MFPRQAKHSETGSVLWRRSIGPKGALGRCAAGGRLNYEKVAS